MIDSRQLAGPAYLTSAALIILPLVDSSTSLYPWNVGDPRWRFGALGLYSNALILPILGVLIAHVTAASLRHPIVRRVIGVGAAVAGALLVGSLAIFALDALQTRASVRPEMSVSFTVASITAAGKITLAAVTLLVTGISGLRALRSERRQHPPSEAPILAGLATPGRRHSRGAGG